MEDDQRVVGAQAEACVKAHANQGLAGAPACLGEMDEVLRAIVQNLDDVAVLRNDFEAACQAINEIRGLQPLPVPKGTNGCIVITVVTTKGQYLVPAASVGAGSNNSDGLASSEHRIEMSPLIGSTPSGVQEMYNQELMESTATLPEAAKNHWFKLSLAAAEYHALATVLKQFDLQLIPEEIPVSIGPAVRDVPAFGDSTHSGVCAHVVIHARYIFNRRTGFTERLDNNVVKYCAFSQESTTTVGGLRKGSENCERLS
eukprot:COSAG01_NODE_2802_length_7049_cov_2.441871_1_plen_258_part_00